MNLFEIRMVFFLGICLLGLTSVTKVNAQSENSVNADEQAESIIQKTIDAHGGALYETAHYEFVFRKKKYTFKNDHDLFSYSVTSEKDGNQINDVLDNEGFRRLMNEEIMTLTDKASKRYSSALNSVIYFATLPHKLKDKAVNKKYMGATTIKKKNYHVVAITFEEEGGGEDHDDTFYYWINKENNIIDYLAYNYKVNNGGVRFRSAYNTRNVDGIIFQDYINYKAAVGTPLKELPGLWEQNALEELSRIETENVKRLN